MANHYFQRVRKNYLKGYTIIVSDHAIEQYADRCEIDYETAQRNIKRKFANTRLRKIFPDGAELRYEVAGSLTERLTFVARKKGRKFEVISCWLQGRKKDFWKQSGGVRIDN